jgi:hypothetical protein
MSDVMISAAMDASSVYRELSKVDAELMQRERANAAQAMAASAAQREQGLSEARASALKTVEWAEGVSKRQAESQQQRFEAMARSARQLMTILPGAWMAAERAIAAYAEKNSVVAAQLQAMRSSRMAIVEDAGRDMAPLLSGVTQTLGVLRDVRNLWVNSQANFYRAIGLGSGDGTGEQFDELNKAIERQDVRAKSLAEMDRLRKQDRIRPDDPVLAARQDMDDALKERQRELDKMQGLGADEKARNLQGLREKHEAAIAEILKRQAEQKDAMREADRQAAADAQQRRAQEMADAQRDASERAQHQAREREAMREQFELEARRPAMTAREADELERLIAFRARLRTIAEMDAIDSTKAELAGAAQAAFMAGNARASMASERGGTVGAGLSGGSNLAQALGASVNWAQTQAKATIEGTELLRKLTGEVADLKRELGLGIGALRV